MQIIKDVIVTVNARAALIDGRISAPFGSEAESCDTVTPRGRFSHAHSHAHKRENNTHYFSQTKDGPFLSPACPVKITCGVGACTQPNRKPFGHERSCAQEWARMGRQAGSGYQERAHAQMHVRVRRARRAHCVCTSLVSSFAPGLSKARKRKNIQYTWKRTLVCACANTPRVCECAHACACFEGAWNRVKVS